MKHDRSDTHEAAEIAGGDKGDPHQYKMPAAAKLSIEGEKAIGLDIQTANRAIESLADAAWPEISWLLDGLDLRPVPSEDVKALASEALASVARSITASQLDANTFAAHVQRSLRDRLTAFFKSHAELGEHLDEWVMNRLLGAGLLTAIASSEAHQELIKRVVADRDKAVNQLVESHMPLARRMAQAAMRQKDELDDLLNEAAVVLRRCALSFDPTAGSRFSSYARTALLELKRRRPSNTTTRYTARQVQGATGDGESGGSNTQIDPISAAVTADKTRRAIENARRLLTPASRSSADPPDPKCQSPLDAVELRDDIEHLLPALRRLSWLERVLPASVYESF
ncbi:MAG TPA: sigma factor [Pirellulales bacterium]|jgi:DNA-directed RNA polymerase specialized sigma subunit|nr:sigma factor [Pirellulales bacterium]